MTYNFSAAAGDQSVFIAQAGQYTNDVTVFLKIRRSTIKNTPGMHIKGFIQGKASK